MTHTSLTKPQQKRIDLVRQALSKTEANSIWVTRPASVRYLSGFSTPEDGRVLITPTQAILFTDSRYTIQAENESAIETIVPVPKPNQTRIEALLHTVNEFVAGHTLAFEAEHISYNEHAQIFNNWKDSKLQAVSDLILKLRRIKDSEEIAIIKNAANITDAVLEKTIHLLQAGTAEKNIAIALETGFKTSGDGAAFEIIVASGPRGAMPHGLASNRTLQHDELVTIDCGAKKDGYCSDMARTYATGKPKPQLKEIYNVVLEAQRAAVEAVKPGMSCKTLDEVARNIIAKAGYADYFGHGLGHGVGLEIHEGPNIGRASEDVLEPGQVITIEPGIYLPGVGGVRIEDLLLVTNDGHEQLSHADKLAV